jgi:hypothetical protein
MTYNISTFSIITPSMMIISSMTLCLTTLNPMTHTHTHTHIHTHINICIYTHICIHPPPTHIYIYRI